MYTINVKLVEKIVLGYELGFVIAFWLVVTDSSYKPKKSHLL